MARLEEASATGRMGQFQLMEKFWWKHPLEDLRIHDINFTFNLESFSFSLETFRRKEKSYRVKPVYTFPVEKV